VEAACLALQDAHGQCVPLLLWAAWAAAEGRSLDPAMLAKAASLARVWEPSVVRPLREARRALRTPPDGADAALTILREQIKTEELAAERLLLKALEAIAGPERSAPAPASLRTALEAAATAWGACPPETALESLVNAFSPP
jgi:uncharacterized protein (TIGR02444 family)